MNGIAPHRLVALLLLVCACWGVLAEQHANVERGFQPGKLYQFLDLDSINLFNGNLSIAIPLGLQYANNGGMSIALSLRYNSKLWDYREEFFQGDYCPTWPEPVPGCTDDPAGPYELALPNRTSNAGLGWAVSLGRLIAPDDPLNDKRLTDDSRPAKKIMGCGPGSVLDGYVCDSLIDWEYESPDGAVTAVAPWQNYQFSPHGPSAIRMRMTDPETVYLDFMDGSIQMFKKLRPERGSWRLKEIRDAFDNTVTIDYNLDETVWTISDAVNRKIYVNFTKSTANPQANYQHLLESIVLPGPKAGGMTYSFEYDLGADGIGRQVIADNSMHYPRGWTNAFQVPLLSKIKLPDIDHEFNTSSFSFTYYLDTSEPAMASAGNATVASMTLPTGGTVRWTYGGIMVAASECQIRGWTDSLAVLTRTFTDGDNVSAWTYSHVVKKTIDNQCSACGGPIEACVPGDPECGIKVRPRREKKTLVRDPAGNLTEHFFTIVPKDMDVSGTACPDADPDMFGQPFTSGTSVQLTNGEKAFLSTISYQKEGTTDVEKRRTYVLYDKVAKFQGNIGSQALYDFHVRAERTQYEDGSFIETLRSDFANGNYRKEETRSSFDNTVRRTFTNYLELPSPTRYILGRYDEVQIEQGQRNPSATTPWELQTQIEKARSFFCFDTANGFLKASRTLRSKDGVPAAGDVKGDIVSMFTSDGHGNVAREQYGLATDTTTDACRLEGHYTPKYDLSHEYELGVRKTSRYNGLAVPFKTLDLTLEPNTGLPGTSKDSAGVLSEFDYDNFGRLIEARSGRRADGTFATTTEYRFHNVAAGVPNAYVEVIRKDPQGGDAIDKHTYDPFGRVTRQSSMMYDGNWSVRETTYNPLGLQKTVSEAGRNNAHSGVTTFAYDAFSRVTSTKSADGKDTLFTYIGPHTTKRTTYVGQTLVNGAVPEVKDEPALTTETYDGFGRLIAVREPLEGSAEETTTYYKYDVGGRLAEVKMGVQTRTFDYDGAGFLKSEDHPETEKIEYGGYDARGHAKTKTIGAEVKLEFYHDGAERLIKVEDTATNATKPVRPLQTFTYDRLGAEEWPGGLLQATRFNYFSTSPGSWLTYSVADQFTYDHDTGRLTKKKSVITRSDEPASPVTFENAADYQYTPLSLPANVPYPTCTGCGALSLPTRNVVLQYQHGALTAVGGFANMTYHPSGLLASVQHLSAGGSAIVRDEQVADPSGRARPGEIKFVGLQDCSSITAQPLDTPVGANGRATFTVAVGGTGVTVKWYRGKRGDTSAEVGTGLSFTTPVLAATTEYWARATDVSGCITDSMTARATVCDGVEIVLPKANEASSVNAGKIVSPAIVATGPSIRYEWTKQVGGGAVETLNATKDTLDYEIPDLAAGTTVVITGSAIGQCPANGVQSRQSRVFTYTIVPEAVCASPQLEVDLTTPWLIFGDEAPTLQVSVMGMRDPVDPVPASDFVFQWYRNGDAIQNTNSPQLAVSVANWDVYQVKITRNCANNKTAESWSSKSYVYRWGTCALPPTTVDQTTIVLPSANLSFTAHNEHPGAQYQWYRGQPGDMRVPLDGDAGHSNRYTAADLPAMYWLRVSLDCGTHEDFGPFVVQRPTCSPVFINQQPQSADIAAGTTVTLYADASSNPAPHYYEWFEGRGDAAHLVGAGPRFTAQPMRTKEYWFRASNPCSSFADSMPAVLRVTSCADISIETQPADRSINEGQFADLQITAHAAETLRYQWYEGESGDDSHPIAGANSAQLSRNPTQTTKYWVRLSFDRVGSCAVDSRTVTVWVCRMPVLRGPLPAPTSLYPSVPKWLSVDVTGDNLQYEWHEGSMSGARIGDTAPMVKVQPSQTTRYYVRVISPCHTPVANATLDVGPIVYSVCPAITAQPQPATVMKNSSATLSVTATGTELRYEWFSIDPDTGLQSGILGTSATFTTPPVTKDLEFRVRVYSGNCVKSSDKALVSYCREPRVTWVKGATQAAANYRQDLQVSITPIDARLYWYQGTAGDVASSTLISGPTVNTAIYVAPAQTTSYWVRAEKPNTSCSDQTTTFTVQVCIPQILTQPQGTLVNSGTPVRLTVAADGGTLAYQWYEGAAGITPKPVGTNTNFLDVTNTATKSYWVRVTGTCGSPVDSDVATVTVCAPPSISQQPANVNTQSGAPFSISVTAAGTDLTYQWYEGAAGVMTTPAGDNAPLLTTSATVTKDYWVKITGMCGSVNSAAARASIPPVITTQPAASTRVTYNTTTTLSVAATGTMQAYQWYSGSGTAQPVSGATSSSYTTPAMTADGSYWVRVFSGSAYKDSNTAAITVCPAPNVTVSQPSSVAGSQVTLTVGNPYPGDTFAWYQGVAPSAATPLGSGTSKIITPLQTTSYWVRATGATCYSDSPTRVVTVCYPRIDAHPQGSMINSGTPTTLSVMAVGTPPLTYQWYAGESGNTAAPISGATSSSVQVAPTVDTSYWVQVRSGAGPGCTANSNAATLTVCNAPAISAQPSSINTNAGTGFTLGVTATGTNLSYQWYQGASGVTTTPVGDHSPALSSSATVTTDYWVKVTGACGTINSAAAKVSIPPSITSEPASTRITYSNTATLSVTASGTQLSYQWYRGSGTTQPVSGATSASYTTPPTTADTSYWVRVYSGTNFRNSALATVTVCPPPTISVTQPSLTAGSAVTMSVTNAYPGDTFSWYEGPVPTLTAPLGGGSSKTVYPTQTTSYWVRSTGATCYADSVTKVVSVCYPRIDAQPQNGGVSNGSSVALSVTAVGTAPLTYQWYAGDSGDLSNPIAGATSASVSVSPSVQTMYWVQVRSGAGGSCTANSSAAVVTVCNKPVITQNPSPAVLSAPGAWATLSVTATGEGLHYAWYQGASTAVGDDSPVLSLPVWVTTDYWVKVSNDCGFVNSATAKVSVPATISSEPADVAICKGQSTTLSITAGGNELSYQWYQGPVGTTTTPLGTATTQSVAPTVTTTYWCRVTSGLANKSSRGAVVTVKASPTISSMTKTPNGSCTRLQVFVASGDVGKVFYTWYLGQPGDQSNPVWSGSTTFDACTNATYWVRVQYSATYGGCSTNSTAVTVP